MLGCPIEDKRDGGMHTSCFMSALMLLIKTGQLMSTEVSTESIDSKLVGRINFVLMFSSIAIVT